ncbi:MAG: hypothetical protein MZV64_42965 [Ignavibacteriales bacterium]|nr:hypothetical protein [Ignavibacteriales bacterium]
MQTAGSATNEFTARIGMIGGMFMKRVLMLFWALAGLLAIGLYAGKPARPGSHLGRDDPRPAPAGRDRPDARRACSPRTCPRSTRRPCPTRRCSSGTSTSRVVPDRTDRHYLTGRPARSSR